MKRQTNLLITLMTCALTGTAAWAQGTTTNLTVNTQAVFRVSFAATCQSFDSSRGRITTTRITDRNIIAQAVGGNPNNRNLTRNFALAYNATQDSLQVVDMNLTPIVDVIHFGGGAAISDGKQLSRFTLLFFPGQTNELGAETNVFGSAVINERTNLVHHTVPNITGRLQFVLTDGNVLGMTNAFTLSGTNGVATSNAVPSLTTTATTPISITNVFQASPFIMTNADIVFDPSARICVGTFTTAGTASAPTFPTGTTGTGTTTTTNTGTTGTNGVTGTTPGVSNVVVINPVSGTATVVPSNTIGTGTVGLIPGTTGIAGTTATGTVGAGTRPGTTASPASVAGVGTLTTPGGATPTGSGFITTGGGTGFTGTMTGIPTGTTGSGITGTTGTTGVTAGTPIVVGP